MILGEEYKINRSVMALPRQSWHDFKTYKPVFERLRPFFWVLMKLNRVPESFYMKFCRPMAAQGTT